jgi:pimeloyl-ACP methyl ester carboxylesterase
MLHLPMLRTFVPPAVALAMGLVRANSFANGPLDPTSPSFQEDRMTVTATKPQTGSAVADPTSIRPFQVRFTDAELADLRRRVQATRFPDAETVTDQTQGVKLATVQALAKYWGTEYDWKKCESRLNSLPQFVTEIDGLDIHFIHVRSKHANAMPIIITHGWPGSIIEELKIIGPLTDPTTYGHSAEDAFDVVIPSMPGYGFSGKPTTTGWGPERIARAWDVLMKRLGYEHYVAQGGDWGALVAELQGVQAPAGLLGIHTNMAMAVPVDVYQASLVNAPMPAGLSAEEQGAYRQLAFFYQHVYYALEMATRPQTLTGLADSPVGLASFLLDHDDRSYVHIAELFVEGTPFGAITRDDILDNVTLYWLTNTAVSSARLYWENKYGFFDPKGVKVPVAVSAFPEELYRCPRSWAERAYSNLLFYKQHEQGGHFASWEEPDALTSDLREAFRPLRVAAVSTAEPTSPR